MARWTIEGLRLGMEYAVEGIYLVFKNPHIRQKKFLRILVSLFILSIVLWILTHLLVTVPLKLVRSVVFVFKGPGGDMNGIEGLLDTTQRTINDMVAYVPVIALLFMRYVYPKPLDDLFIESLRYIDEPLTARQSSSDLLNKEKKEKKDKWLGMKLYIRRTWKKVRLGILVFLLSLIPVVGKFVFPAVGAYSSFKALGRTQGIAVGICFFFLPQWATMKLVRALIGMRSLVRELLEPYFSRMKMTHKEKIKWFSGRKDIIFGFSAIAYLIIRIPYIGLINYGIAQCAVCYILTKVIDPVTLQPIDFKELRQNSGSQIIKQEEKSSINKLD
ncbi:hypothetical protein BJ944DRAFT_172218 [Cunninghamella echinulata]|nr:hypothetical protein BJ944DRAFT_172218 [Cunninghamella echinulata]